ncbi:MAG: hypothetical protein ABIW76_18845 [Fibrobacteria bacterium]
MAMAFLAMASANGATFTVSKDGRGAFTTIQAAVDKAGKGDIVEILDAAVYPEQVTLDSNKHGLTLRSSNPTALKKPTIKWEDTQNQGPKTCQEALTPAKITFDQNGALRLLRVRNVLIDGIGIDAVKALPFSFDAVWGNGVDCTSGQRFPLFHGNGGIALFIAGNVTVRNCDITNAFFGISVKDRNEGGVFANVNPADLEKSNVIPLSGFGKTGNHVFEKNRVHHNVWGFYFESSWDLGSTARYNLIYENHHATAASAAAVKAMVGGDGAHHPGGGFLFKDVMLSPMAIYNNTFWHNFTLFAGGYRPGAQHLAFNNIYAQPNEYWSKSVSYSNPFHVLDPHMINRMKHCLYAAQTQAPEKQTRNVQEQMQDPVTNQPVRDDSNVVFYQSTRIMNGMGNVAQENFTVDLTLELSSGPVIRQATIQGANLPGGLIRGATATEAFPANANIRWYEIQFKSTDPASPDFLSPDWDNEVVKKYVMNAGWPEAGIFNADGKVADLGAIPSSERHKDDVVIRPLSPVMITGTTATLNFDLSAVAGDLTAPKIKYIKLVRSLPVLLTGFGGVPALVVPPPVSVTPSTTALQMGANTITANFQTPFPATEKYAFFEIIVEGTGSNGQPATTSVGFLPYRTLDKKFKVEILDAGGNPTDSVRVGEAVKLRISPLNLDGTTFAGAISQTEVFLGSGADLLTGDNPPEKFVLPSITGITTKDVLFTKIPRGGLEYVNATGIAKTPSVYVFFGSSNPIRILPAAPEKVIFQDPPSKILTPGAAPVIDPGVLYTVKVEVRDRFDNVVTAPVTVTIKSNNPAIGDIDGAVTATTDLLGIATFKAKVTNGDLDQTFELEASIPGKPADKADLKVGKARDKLWILYADTVAYSANTELRGVAGERLRVTVRAGKTPDEKLTDRVTVFQVGATPGLAVFATPTSAAQVNTYTLVNGEAVFYVTGTMPVSNGSLTATPTVDNTILGADRGKIFFTLSPFSIASASCHADNGYAAVDRVEFQFTQDLKRAPDSIRIAWPAAGQNLRTVSTGITLDPANPRHVSLRLSPAFPEGLSSGSGPVTAYSFDPATPDIPVQAANFTAVDAVGPLLDSAKVQEKIAAGGDTLYVAINEITTLNSLSGASLVLIKKSGGAPIVLAVLSPTENPRAGEAGKGFRIVLADLGAQAPVAGDSLRINATGPLTDIAGNHAHIANRAVVIGMRPTPRPPVLLVRMDRPLQGVENQVQARDFLVLASNPDASWTPVQGSVDRGHTAPCAGGMDCGGPVAGDATGAIDRPAITVETDRAMKYSITLFTNLGEFVNGFSGEITNAQLGLDDHNLPIAGAVADFRRGPEGKFAVKISWNAKAQNGGRTATGVYLAKVNAVSLAEDADGKPFTLNQSRVIRFGLVRH